MVFLLGSCSKEAGKRELVYKSVDSALQYISKRDEASILKMAYKDSFDNLANDETRRFYVEKTAELLDSYGIPPKERWLFLKLPLFYEVHVPLFDTSKLEDAKPEFELIIKYTPDGIGNQICDIDLVRWQIQKQVNDGMKYERRRAD